MYPLRSKHKTFFFYVVAKSRAINGEADQKKKIRKYRKLNETIDKLPCVTCSREMLARNSCLLLSRRKKMCSANVSIYLCSATIRSYRTLEPNWKLNTRLVSFELKQYFSNGCCSDSVVSTTTAFCYWLIWYAVSSLASSPSPPPCESSVVSTENCVFENGHVVAWIYGYTRYTEYGVYTYRLLSLLHIVCTGGWRLVPFHHRTTSTHTHTYVCRLLFFIEWQSVTS